MFPVELGQTEDGAVIAAFGSGWIGIVLEELELHPAALTTVAFNVTAPEAPAVNLIVRVPAPDVIVPFVIVQP